MKTLTGNQSALAGLVIGVVVFFIVTTLLLGYTLESLDDEDLLTASNDARMNTWGSRGKGLRSTVVPGLGLRRDFEQEHSYPSDLQAVVRKLHKPLPPTPSDVPYDIFNCPENPPVGYPYAWKVLDILKEWNPDVTDLPNTIHQSLCVFDWTTEADKALRYREAELPFVVQNHPELLKTAYRWQQPNYLEELVGDREYRNEHSTSNHMMFWRTHHLAKRFIPSGWQSPTKDVGLTFQDWRRKAQELERKPDHTLEEHWYFRLNAAPQTNGGNSYQMYNELPIFEPSQAGFFMVDPAKARGINCRFGMKGVIAEAHFDPSRNFVVLLGGQRRYILAHPSQCANMELYPFRHPSGRHSSVDWSHPPASSEDRPFTQAVANELVLQAGDAMYLPTSWFHFIVSLNENYQCNARSGVTYENEHHIKKCGLGPQPAPV